MQGSSECSEEEPESGDERGSDGSLSSTVPSAPPAQPPHALDLTPHPASAQGSSEILCQVRDWDEQYGDDAPLTIAEVREEGWVMEDSWAGLFGGCPPRGGRAGADRPLLRLPPEVARLGMPGGSLSCMRLGLRRGVWRPFNPHCDATCVANAYPPTPWD